MTELMKYSQIGVQDLNLGTGTFQVTLADGRVVTMDQVSLGEIPGDVSHATVLATGSTTRRTLAGRFADWVNVLDYGAKGDGVTDDTAAIQAAVNALDTGTEINGKIIFPAGNYLISSSIAIGNGTKTVTLELEGIDIVYGSYIPNGPVRIFTTASNIHLFTINMGANSSGLKMHGFTLEHPAAATGTAIYIPTASNFLEFAHIACYNSGHGIYYVGGTVSPIHRNVCFYDCTTAGLRVGVIMTDGLFDSCYFQQGNANGVVIDSACSLAATFLKCTFQSNAASDFLLNGSMETTHFIGCWQEEGAGSFIKIVGAKLLGVQFIGMHFAGSNGAAFHLIENAAAAASQIYGQDLLFSGGDIANLNGGKILQIATDPAASSEPGFFRVTLTGVSSTETGTLFKGLHEQASQPANCLLLENTPWTAANVANNTTYGTKPRTIMLGGSSDKFNAFTDADTTPSVAGGYHFTVTNSGATTITMFDDGYVGQEIVLVFTDANTTLTDGGNLKLAGGFTSSADDTMRLIFDGTNWYEVSRSVN